MSKAKDVARKVDQVLEGGAESLYARAMQSKHGWLLLAACVVVGFVLGAVLV